MRNMITIVLACSLITACGKKQDDKSVSSNTDATKTFLIQNSMGSFFDVSSELRCDAIKLFLIRFAGQQLGGATVDAFNCLDNSGAGNIYSVKAEISLAGKTSVLIQHIWDKVALPTEYCDLPFNGSSFATCGYEPSYFGSSSSTTVKGLLHPNLSLLREFTTAYVSEKQSQDLAYGIDVEDFAVQWVQKFDGTHQYSLASSNGALDIWLKLDAGSKGAKTGLATIEDANIGMFATGKSFFNCKDLQCLKSREYSYKFNGHHLAIQTKDGDTLVLTLRQP